MTRGSIEDLARYMKSVPAAHVTLSRLVRPGVDTRFHALVARDVIEQLPIDAERFDVIDAIEQHFDVSI